MKFRFYLPNFFYKFRDFLCECASLDYKWGGELTGFVRKFCEFSDKFRLEEVSTEVERRE